MVIGLGTVLFVRNGAISANGCTILTDTAPALSQDGATLRLPVQTIANRFGVSIQHIPAGNLSRAVDGIPKSAAGRHPQRSDADERVVCAASMHFGAAFSVDQRQSPSGNGRQRGG